jgi:hypothetical protein
MAMETCAACGDLIIFGAQLVGTKPYCPNCKPKALALQAQQEAQRKVKQTRDAYQAAMEHLRLSPSDPIRREQALELGRQYATWTRRAHGQVGVTLYDEVALANDIAAACAGVAISTTLATAGSPSPEQRLQKLAELRAKSLITEEEFAAKRQQILNEL